MSETFLGHPKGLAVCGFTEIWERFAYFGMLSLLILYLTKSYGLSDADGNRMVGAFGALVFMLPVIGGALADTWLGSRKSVVLGSILLSVGYVSIALPNGVIRALGLDTGPNGLPPISFLLFSMAAIVVGVGFLKSNIASVVGALYTDDSARNVGISIFYWTICVGGALGPFVCSAVGEAFGLRYGFSVAGGVMLIALITFLWGQRYLSEHTGPPSQERIQRKVAPLLSLEHALYLAGIISILVVWQVLELHEFIPRLLVWFAVGLVIAVAYFAIRQCDAEERGKMIVVGTLLLFTALFAVLNFQLYGSMMLFTDRYVDKQILGWQFTAPMMVTIGSLMSLIAVPLAAILWNWLEKRGLAVSIPLKFAIGLFTTGLTFLVPVLAVSISGDATALHSGWLLLMLWLFVVGDVCVVPVGLSMMPTLCPKRVVAMMIGALYFTLALGNSWGGEFAARFTSAKAALNGEATSFEAGMDVFVSMYTLLGSIGVAGSLVLAALIPILLRLLKSTVIPAAQS